MGLKHVWTQSANAGQQKSNKSFFRSYEILNSQGRKWHCLDVGHTPTKSTPNPFRHPHPRAPPLKLFQPLLI